MSRTPNHAVGAPKAAGPTPGAARTTAAHAPAHAAPAAPAGAATATGTPASQPAGLKSRRNLIAGGVAVAAIALLVTLFTWRPWAPDAPRLNDDPAAIAKFAVTDELHNLPFSMQRQYMELLDDKDERVEEAYEQGMLNDQEYRRALQLEWYGEHLKKMDNFHSKPPTLRAMYLDKQVDKKQRKKAKEKDKPEDAKSALTAADIDRDDSTEEADVKRWPAEVRQRWNDYRNAYASRKQYWKDLEKQQKEAREANKGEAGTPAAPSNGPAAAAGNPEMP